jgi:hypothetical protein
MWRKAALAAILAPVRLAIAAGSLPIPEPGPVLTWGELPQSVRLVAEQSAEIAAHWEQRFLCTEERYRDATHSLIGDGACVSCAEYRLSKPDAPIDPPREQRDRLPGCNGDLICRKAAYPVPTDWFRLLREPLRSSLRFRARCQDERFCDLDWVSAAAGGRHDLNQARAWSGTFKLDLVKQRLLELEAAPNFEARTRETRRMRYQTAFRLNLLIFGFVAAPKPRLHTVKVTFGMEAKGMMWPSAVEYREEMAISKQDDAVLVRETALYSAYRFFETSIDQRYQGEVDSKQ